MELLEGFSHYLCRITIDYICSTPYLYFILLEFLVIEKKGGLVC